MTGEKRSRVSKGPREPIWNSLELAKIVVGILTPIAIFALGYVVSTSNRDEQQKVEQQLRAEARKDAILTRRMEIWNKGAPIVANIVQLAGAMDEGRRHGKVISPRDAEQMIRSARELRATVEPYLSYFTPEFGDRFYVLTKSAFILADAANTNDLTEAMYVDLEVAQNELIEASRSDLMPSDAPNPKVMALPRLSED